MKTLSSIAAVLALLGLTAVSCQKAPHYPPSLTSGSLKINGHSYDLTNGYLENFGPDSTYLGTYFDLYLMSDGVNRITRDGTGQVVYFKMYSSDYDDLAPGVYKYSTSNDTAIFKSALITDYENSAISTFRYNVVGGEIEVSKSGSIYTVKGTLQCYDGFVLDSATAEIEYSGLFYIN